MASNLSVTGIIKCEECGFRTKIGFQGLTLEAARRFAIERGRIGGEYHRDKLTSRGHFCPGMSSYEHWSIVDTTTRAVVETGSREL